MSAPATTAPGARLALGRVAADVRLSGDAAQVLAVERRVAAIGRTALPRRLAGLFDPGEGPEVLRIARVSLTLELDLHELMSGDFPDAWARGVAAAVAARMNEGGGTRGIARFPGPEAFAAAYLLRRAGQTDVPAWAFADFAALEHLTAAEAAVELLRAAPAILPALVRAAGPAAPQRLAQLLPLLEALRLFEGLAAETAQPPAPDAVEADRIAAALVAAPPAPVHVGALLALAALVPPATRDRRRAAELAVETRLAVMLDCIACASVAPLSPALAQPDPLAPHALLMRRIASLPAAERSWASAALATIAESDLPLLRRLAKAVDARRFRNAAAPVAPPSRRADRSAEIREPGTTDASGPAAAPVTELWSDFGGVALVLPLIRDLGLWRGLPPRAFRDTLTALAPEPRRDRAAHDPFLAAVSPPDRPEHEGPVPPVPDTALAHLPGPAREAIAAAEGAEAWARLIAARFAERLPGLQGSTPSYLAEQFFLRPGRVRLDPAAIAVWLPPIPLGVVLRIGGLIGERGALPWLDDRRLAIVLEGG